jgi:nitrogen fixation NifU-like protein
VGGALTWAEDTEGNSSIQQEKNMAYSEKVLDHYENPRNVGTFGKEADDVGDRHGGRSRLWRRDEAADQGRQGWRHRGCQVQDLWLRLGDCLIVAGDRVGQGQDLDQALDIKNTQIAEELALPPVKIHCSILAEDAIKAAVADYKQKHGG